MIRAYSAAIAVLIFFEAFALFTLLRLDGRVAYASFALIALVGAVLVVTMFVQTRSWEQDRQRRQAAAHTNSV